MKKAFMANFLLIGTVVGAGFASGRELLTFFGGDITLAPVKIITSAVFFFFTSMLFLSLGRFSSCEKISVFLKHLFGKFAIVFEILILFSFLALSSIMLAGVDSLFLSLGISSIFPSIVTYLLGVFIVSKGIEGLLKTNTFLIPLLLVFIVVISFFELGKPLLASPGGNAIKGALGGILHGSMNMLLSGFVLIKAGRDMSKKEILLSSTFSSILIAFTISIFIYAMHTNEAFLLADMPILEMAKKYSKAIVYFGTGIIWIGVFTTFLSCLQGAFDYGKLFIHQDTINFFLLFVIIYPLSKFGFTNLIDYILPFESLLGITFIIFSAIFYFKEKKRSSEMPESPHNAPLR